VTNIAANSAVMAAQTVPRITCVGIFEVEKTHVAKKVSFALAFSFSFGSAKRLGESLSQKVKSPNTYTIRCTSTIISAKTHTCNSTRAGLVLSLLRL